MICTWRLSELWQQTAPADVVQNYLEIAWKSRQIFRWQRSFSVPAANFKPIGIGFMFGTSLLPLYGKLSTVWEDKCKTWTSTEPHLKEHRVFNLPPLSFNIAKQCFVLSRLFVRPSPIFIKRKSNRFRGEKKSFQSQRVLLCVLLGC